VPREVEHPCPSAWERSTATLSLPALTRKWCSVRARLRAGAGCATSPRRDRCARPDDARAHVGQRRVQGPARTRVRRGPQIQRKRWSGCCRSISALLLEAGKRRDDRQAAIKDNGLAGEEAGAVGDDPGDAARLPRRRCAAGVGRRPPPSSPRSRARAPFKEA
jgi:hypothetical protein